MRHESYIEHNHFTKQAPVHIVIVEESANISAGLGGWIKRKHFPHIDIGVAAAHIVLAAAAEGWAVVCWGGSTKKAMRKVLGIPSGKKSYTRYCSRIFGAGTS